IDATAEQTDALLYGRRTWQIMAGGGPARAGGPFADRINTIPQYVVSHTPGGDHLTGGPTTLLRGADPGPAVEELRRAPGREVNVLGSARLTRALVAHDFVDELNLMIEPVVLGGGKRIFPDDGIARTLELAQATTSSTGVQICRYVRRR